MPEMRGEEIRKTWNTLSPRKKFYRIPLSFQIQNLTRNPKFTESLIKMKAALQEGVTHENSFWGGTIVEDITSEDSFLPKFLQVPFPFLLLFSHSKN